MKIVDTTAKPTRARAQETESSALREPWFALGPLVLVVVLSLLAGAMAYQAPPAGAVTIGWIGDRLFLDASAGLGAEAAERGALYPDDLTPDAPTGRSRWTRQYAVITLPNLGAGSDLDVLLRVQGWPDDVLVAPVAQPLVTVRADGVAIGSFEPVASWEEYRFRIPAAQRRSGDVTIELMSSATFTDTARGADPRPKGVRLAELQVRAAEGDPRSLLPPDLGALALFTLAVSLLYVLLLRLIGSAPLVYVLTTIGAGLAAIGLALSRIWMGAALSVAIWGLLGTLLLISAPRLLFYTRALLRRYSSGRALSYGLVTAALAWLGYNLALASRSFQLPIRLFQQTFPDSLLYGLLGAGLLALIFVLGREGLPRLSDAIVGAVGSRRGAFALLLLGSAVWFGYQAALIARLNYVGHADYADNAVVARNLVAGRGWTVDYVTQFYWLYESLTRPQETWPLMQPVWIAPFFALLGAEDWVAKLPNLLFNALLLLLIYTIGARLWDRRVGLTAALFTLTNYLFVRLTIYVTSDLAFVVFSVAAIYCLYRAVGENREPSTENPEPRTREQRNQNARQQTGDKRRVTTEEKRFAFFAALRLTLERRYLVAAGMLTGLMMLQKPSGAMIALGMGLWFLAVRLGGNSEVRSQDSEVPGRDLHLVRRFLQRLMPIVVWASIALIVLSPYLVRNMALFGRPVFSTESYDAWVLGYRGEAAWDDIYRIFAPELNGLGLPDRSWILRWGFDYTGAKFITQAEALRDYLLPVWAGLPEPLAQLGASNEAKNIAAPLGAWFGLIGLVMALRFRRRLVGLLAMAYAPYMAFMLTYWRTDEQRYWVILIPGSHCWRRGHSGPVTIDWRQSAIDVGHRWAGY
ncbi:glycosyltransferase family 39 protein [Candidatus Gracilibacteria bacterium]|nr:glycosyltransferase family 39 protein [Candidatus Gracilibacteria bacterium]